MSEASSHSLILAQESEDDTQLCFMLGDSSPKVDRSKPKFDYTGERLFRDRPEIYRAVVMLLAEPGVSDRQICRICHVTHATVTAVAAREAIPITAHKKQILGTIARGLRLCAERVVELAPSMSAKDAIIGVGVLTEKTQLLSGEATSRPEIMAGGNIFEQFARFHEKVASAHVVSPVALNNGSESENPPAKGESAGDPAAGPTDSESDAPANDHQATEETTATNDPITAGESNTDSSDGEPRPSGGGRGSALETGRLSLTHNPSRNFYDKGGSQ